MNMFCRTCSVDRLILHDDNFEYTEGLPRNIELSQNELVIRAIDRTIDRTGFDSSTPLHGSRLVKYIGRLFDIHDFNGNGLLDLDELIAINVIIARLRYGNKTDTFAVETRYRNMYWRSLSPSGRPVDRTGFITYTLGVLADMDEDFNAQELIMEQFIAEAEAARNIYFDDAVYACDGRSTTTRCPSSSSCFSDTMSDDVLFEDTALKTNIFRTPSTCKL